MSSEAIGYVFRHSPFKGAVLACHLAAADSVNDQNGNELWLTAGNLAAKARVARPTASEALGALVDAGYLFPLDPKRARGDDGTEKAWHRSRRYVFIFKDAPVVYESRRRRIVSGEVSPTLTPRPSSEVSPPTTPGVTTDDTRCHPRRHITQENPTEPKGRRRAAPRPRTDIAAAVNRAVDSWRTRWIETHHGAEPFSDWRNATARAARKALEDDIPLDVVVLCLAACVDEKKHPRNLPFVIADWQTEHALEATS